MVEHMLSTIDNPYNPFTQYEEWDRYDRDSGYHSSSFLARVVRTSHDLSDSDHSAAIEAAIEEIVRENVSGVHIKVTKDFVPRQR